MKTPLRLIAYRGEYIPRDPVLFYPLDPMIEQEQSGVWTATVCQCCEKTFQAKRRTLCCSPHCADRLLGREPETSRVPRIPSPARPELGMRINDAETS